MYSNCRCIITLKTSHDTSLPTISWYKCWEKQQSATQTLLIFSAHDTRGTYNLALHSKQWTCRNFPFPLKGSSASSCSSPGARGASHSPPSGSFHLLHSVSICPAVLTFLKSFSLLLSHPVCLRIANIHSLNDHCLSLALWRCIFLSQVWVLQSGMWRCFSVTPIWDAGNAPQQSCSLKHIIHLSLFSPVISSTVTCICIIIRFSNTCTKKNRLCYSFRTRDGSSQLCFIMHY